MGNVLKIKDELIVDDFTASPGALRRSGTSNALPTKHSSRSSGGPLRDITSQLTTRSGSATSTFAPPSAVYTPIGCCRSATMRRCSISTSCATSWPVRTMCSPALSRRRSHSRPRTSAYGHERSHLTPQIRRACAAQEADDASRDLDARSSSLRPRMTCIVGEATIEVSSDAV